MTTYYQKYYAKNKERILARRRETYDPVARKGYDLKWKYGITKEDYDRMYEMQDGDCLICGEREGTYVDHDHETGEVRGLLCNQCNTAIGKLKDNPDIMRAAADYVERT